jgi:hypothetical protein
VAEIPELETEEEYQYPQQINVLHRAFTAGISFCLQLLSVRCYVTVYSVSTSEALDTLKLVRM